MTASTKAPTWPTAAELDPAETATSQASIQVGIICDALRALVDLDAAPSVREDDGVLPPSVTELGLLSAFIAKLRADLGYASEYLDEITRMRDEAALEVTT